MKAFIYSSLPQRVVFGAGSLAQLEREVDALRCHKALILCTPEQKDSAQQVADLLGARAAGVFDQAMMHVPIETAWQARDKALKLGADCAIAIGGGSTTGLGKAIALESGLPIVAIPTTYAGSEMTTIYGITEAGIKKTGRDPRVLPRTVIYDPLLTLSLPVALSITSGINAMAHAFESLYAIDGNPIIDLISLEGIASLYQSLPRLHHNNQDIDARTQALYGAWLCGQALCGAGMALHHKLCHTLGGSFNLPHAETHTIVLPHALAYNQSAAPEPFRRMATAMQCTSGHVSVPQAVFDLAKNHGVPVALKELGLTEVQLNQALDLALQNQYPNPRPLERQALKHLLYNAWQGHRPD
jgi:alcohol dehydrogenase class IV